jgi:ABC-2 type transport system ATP-binding protein
MERLRKYTTIFYSTHILDDVQQVSDTVAILNNGRLVTQGPIESLLGDQGQSVFAVTMKGDTAGTRDLLQQQPWVAQVDTAYENGATQWQVSVSDEAVAERELFRLLAHNEAATVLEYGRKRYELEEIFMQLVEGEGNDG